MKNSLLFVYIPVQGHLCICGISLFNLGAGQNKKFYTCAQSTKSLYKSTDYPLNLAFPYLS